MIFVDRTRVLIPSSLNDITAEEKRKQVAEFFKIPEIERKQKKFDFSLKFADPEVRESLRMLFYDKCAYCEMPISFEIGGAYLDRFRPYSNAIGQTGEVDPDHYWWLAFEWENMFSCCAQCNRAKGSRFPIAGGRATPNTYSDMLEDEHPLLLNPCVDFPSEHLIFSKDGLVSGRTMKGKITIEIFALNRPELVRLREQESIKFLAEYQDKINSLSDGGDLVQSSLPFAGLRKSLLATLENGMNARAERIWRKEQKEYDTSRQQLSVASESRDISLERGRARYIVKIELKNIGVLSDVTFEIRSASSSGAPWMVILGENGFGKSTLLKAIAFTLAGTKEWTRLGPYGSALVPTETQKGHVEVTFTDGDKVRLSIDRKRRRVSVNTQWPKVFLLGFGATRLPATEYHHPPVEPKYCRLLNLFDPYSPLGNATNWLLSLDDIQFERAARTLKDLLNLPENAEFERKEAIVSLHESNLNRSILNLSDGQQAVIAVGCDIMSVLLEPDMPIETAEGIVLIDEIGNHLHPSWRMKIVRSLKKAFPKVQFIATTHEPLCLRGLENDEIIVLKKDRNNRIKLMENLPPIKGLLVDQILSSSHFGLNSTLDPDTANLVDEYYQLLANPNRDDTQNTRLQTLGHDMERHRLIGDTPREQIFYRAIDQHLAAAAADLIPVNPADLPVELKEKLDGLWSASPTDY